MRIPAILLTVLLIGACDDPPPADENVAEVQSTTSSRVEHTTFWEDTVPARDDRVVELVEVATFGAPTDSVLLRRFPLLARDRRGFTYAVPRLVDDHEILAFGPSGRLVRTVGGHGDGPGEFRRVIALAAGAADSLVLVHDGNRVTVFDSTGALGRTFTTEHPVRPPRPGISSMGIQSTLIPLPGGGFVTATGVEDAGGLPLHVFSAEGAHERAFGTPTLRPSDAPGSEEHFPSRLIHSGTAGGFWVSELNNYRLEKFDLTGQSLRVVAVSPPAGSMSRAFLSSAQMDSVARGAPGRNAMEGWSARPTALTSPPYFEVAGISERADGLLLVGLHYAAEDWAEVAVEWEQEGEMEATLPGESTYPRLHRTGIDVIEVATGRLLARTAVPGYGFVLSDGTLAMMEQIPEGVIRVRVLEIVVR